MTCFTTGRSWTASCPRRARRCGRPRRFSTSTRARIAHARHSRRTSSVCASGSRAPPSAPGARPTTCSSSACRRRRGRAHPRRHRGRRRRAGREPRPGGQGQDRRARADPVPWHLIGHLQTNKVKDALPAVRSHPVARPPGAGAASSSGARPRRAGRSTRCSQVNVGERGEQGRRRARRGERRRSTRSAALPRAGPRAHGDSPARSSGPEDSRPVVPPRCASWPTGTGCASCRWA